MWILLLALVPPALIAGAVLGAVAFFRQRDLLHRLAALEMRLAQTGAPEPASRMRQDAPPVPASAPPGEMPKADQDTARPAAAGARRTVGALERNVASRWMVWLGGATLALAVVLFFGYAVGHGWLSPTVRVLLGALFGAGLIGAGHAALTAAARPERALPAHNFVPAALTGAGLFALYASIQVAYAVYGLVPGLVAFASLALTGFFGVVLSVRQGWFVAALGMVGAYLAPALIAAPDPSATAFFTYLLGLTGFCLWLLNSRDWPNLATATGLGAFGWALLWMADSWKPGDELVVGPFLLALGGLYALFPPHPPQRPTVVRSRAAALQDEVAAAALSGLAIAGLMLLALLEVAHHTGAAVLALAAYGLMVFVLWWRGLASEASIAIAAGITLAAFLLWPQGILFVEDGSTFDRSRTLLHLAALPLAPGGRLLAWSAAGLSAGFGVAAFLGMSRSRFPEILAAVAAAVPLIALVCLYHHLGAFETSVVWAGIAVAIAVANFGAAVRAVALRAGLGDAPVAAFAAATTAALALAFSCILRDAWLSVALALEVLALAWIWSRLHVEGLRTVAAIAATLALALMAARIGEVEQGAGAGARLLHVGYGYGLPLLLFGRAARVFGLRPESRPGIIADAVLIALGLLTGSLAIHAAAGAAGPAAVFAERAVQCCWWLAAGLWLLAPRRADRSVAALVGGNAALALALLVLAVGNLALRNPALTGIAVGGQPVFNLLGLSYLLPAVLLAAGATRPDLRLNAVLRRLTWPIAGGLAFLYLTLEAVRTVQGTRITIGPDMGEAGLYAISLVWLAYALALLAAAIRLGSDAIRLGALAVLSATVLKVFLIDTAGLSGLLRIGSFLCLGFVLVGVGEIYRRFVGLGDAGGR